MLGDDEFVIDHNRGAVAGGRAEGVGDSQFIDSQAAGLASNLEGRSRRPWKESVIL
jgi:hypothetical protein